uniref:Na/Pi-cotransporter II-related protein n=1 Tax=Magnetococcus massalia (strain MO-1) TaxID=451514 RepID=A0A1S7LLB0_MAGMO|nr:Na/Pi-cotransporter II-related protein [Candidatus Magnetococcus massalia]
MPNSVPGGITIMLSSSSTTPPLANLHWRLLGVILFLVVGVMAMGESAWAGETAATQEMPWGTMAMGLLGGLALFLFGMEMMADALKAVAGDRMRMILAKLTTNRVSGAITGAFVTAVIQSSSVTTVLVVGFISAGLMSLSQAVGVIMGANIGTTITAQIVAFKVTKAASLLVAIGFLLNAAGKSDKQKNYGAMIMGLGMIFLGMSMMSGAMKPLREFQPFLDMMISMQNPLLAILVAAMFTGLVQSSSATTGIVIVMASQGFITLEAGIALAFGANVGTCVTAMLASIGKPREAVRAAMAHVLFNIAGVLIWLGLIDNLAHWVTVISPQSPELDGMARLAAESPRQIANAHTLFNIANTLIFLPFTVPFALLIQKLVPDKAVAATAGKGEVQVKPLYLDDVLLHTPALALDATRRELKGMGLRCGLILNDALPIILHGDEKALADFKERDEEIDVLYSHFIDYLGKVSRGKLTDKQTEEMINLVNAVDTVENIGDIIETNLVHIGRQRLKNNLTLDPESEAFLRQVHTLVLESLEAAMWAITERDSKAISRVLDINDQIDELVTASSINHLKQVRAEDASRVEHYSIVRDYLDKMRRIYSFTKALARLAEDTIDANKEVEDFLEDTLHQLDDDEIELAKKP